MQVMQGRGRLLPVWPVTLGRGRRSRDQCVVCVAEDNSKDTVFVVSRWNGVSCTLRSSAQLTGAPNRKGLSVCLPCWSSLLWLTDNDHVVMSVGTSSLGSFSSLSFDIIRCHVLPSYLTGSLFPLLYYIVSMLLCFRQLFSLSTQGRKILLANCSYQWKCQLFPFFSELLVVV